MINIVIPMAGAGSRFAKEGYSVHKPAILTTDRRTGKDCPMVVCATKDLPCVSDDGRNVIYIDRTFHKKDGVEDEILKHYPKANFITVENLTEGQASTCLLAKDKINNDNELLIAGCDNGMVIDKEKFNKIKTQADVLVFTYRHNEAVLANPNAYGWIRVDNNENVTGLSIKKAISDDPMNDHAVVATFWFRHGSDFVKATEKMILENDRINGEFYVDEVVKHSLELGQICKVFEIERYIGWGTPKDYEEYMSTIRYWRSYVNDKGFIPKD